MTDTPTRYPLAWPIGRPRTAQRQTSQFAPTTVDRETKNVLRELDLLRADEGVVISTNRRLRIDGLPYSNAKQPDDPGVAIYFKMHGRDYCLACDSWLRIEHNIRAIVLHIAAMRGQQRWGVGTVEEQFRGYEALPDNSSQWRSILGAEIKTLAEAEAAYRELARERHPDMPNGSTELMQELEGAITAARKELT